MNIIVADDDKMLSRMLCTILKEGGHTAIPAYDAMQTMMYTMKHLPDLVLLDINMPGGTGIDVLRRLKTSAKTSHVPVIVLTGSTDPAVREKAIELGANQFLAKPIEPDVLLQAVRDAK